MEVIDSLKLDFVVVSINFVGVVQIVRDINQFAFIDFGGSINSFKVTSLGDLLVYEVLLLRLLSQIESDGPVLKTLFKL